VAVSLPKYNDFHWPAVVALRELGDSATVKSRDVVYDVVV
jgi:hypothetical protein